jgi:hypothetical protein
MERQLLWNYEVEDRLEGINQGTMRYFFMIINEPREIEDIQKKLEEQLVYSRDSITREGVIQGLKYRLLSLLSDRRPDLIDFNQVYRGKVRKERKLGTRELGLDGLEASIVASLEKGTL